MIGRVVCAVLFLLPLAASSAAPGALAVINDAAGKEVGRATFVSMKSGVRMVLTVSGLAPGKHAMHIHEVGKCEDPDFSSAGGHFGMMSAEHSMHGAMHGGSGAHAGDFPDLAVGEDGKGHATILVRGATLGGGDTSLLSGSGTALVIHQGPGTSPVRIACGVIERR